MRWTTSTAPATAAITAKCQFRTTHRMRLGFMGCSLLMRGEQRGDDVGDQGADDKHAHPRRPSVELAEFLLKGLVAFGLKVFGGLKTFLNARVEVSKPLGQLRTPHVVVAVCVHP